jgi:hypothetical protein
VVKRYNIVPVFLANQPLHDHHPGLYALHSEYEEMNRFKQVLTDLSNTEWLWSGAPNQFRQDYQNSKTFMQQAIDDQLGSVKALLNEFSRNGNVTSLFADIDQPKSSTISVVLSKAVKHKSSAIGSIPPFSLIRLFGIQFGEGIVLLTGGGLKTSGNSYQNEPFLADDYKETKKMATLLEKQGADVDWFQGNDSEPFDT